MKYGSYHFAQNHGIKSVFFAELTGAILAIEIAHSMGWNCFWLESDSEMVVKAFNNLIVVPWKIRNWWNNYIGLTKNMNFIVGHIYGAGNICADRIASRVTTITGFCWWILSHSHLLSRLSFLGIDYIFLTIGLRRCFWTWVWLPPVVFCNESHGCCQWWVVVRVPTLLGSYSLLWCVCTPSFAWKNPFVFLLFYPQ